MIRYPNGVGEFLPGTHNTHLHAGASKVGWPADHSVDDTYEAPPYTWKPSGTGATIIKDKPEYSAGYTGSGKAILVISTPERTIAYFDTYADAVTAAEALNNLKGY